MGEVYKATDTRLHRSVAVKILLSHFATDTLLRQRFEHEARTLGTLKHPHICPIHDVGSVDGTDYLVMEFLDGETLSDRLDRAALPLDLALTIGIAIADALDSAHRAGIVHRDLKPGNIMLTTERREAGRFRAREGHRDAATRRLVSRRCKQRRP